jgi:outer membrane protein assembly factor BamE (lipoprotein component of BamABCDE complex)
MYKILIILLFFLISNCSLKKVEKHHGVNFLENKEKKLFLSTTNVNDILKILGPPSTKSTFDNDLWIYIERRNSKSNILTLGKKNTIKNNVLVLEIDTKGLLVKKDFFNIDNMNQLNFSKDTTTNIYSKKSFVYDFLSSMRQKINDPLGKRKNRRKEN